MANDLVGTTLILIRHAERENPAVNQDPHLNAAGRARAQELVHVLGKSEIKAIYNSHFIRSKETAQPLAAHLTGVVRVQLDEPVQIKSDILANRKGKTVLVIGHSDTVPALIGLMGGGSMPNINEPEFDNMFVVTLTSAATARVTKLKYGARS